MTNHYGNPLVTAESPRLFLFCRTNDKILPSHEDPSLIHSTMTSQKYKLPPTGLLPSQHPGVNDFTKGYSSYSKNFVKGGRNYNSPLDKEEEVTDSTRQKETRRQEAMSGSTITSMPITTDKNKRDDPLTLLLQKTTQHHPLKSNFSSSTTTNTTTSISSTGEQERSIRRPTHRRRRRNNHALCEDDFEKVLPELF